MIRPIGDIKQVIIKPGQINKKKVKTRKGKRKITNAVKSTINVIKNLTRKNNETKQKVNLKFTNNVTLQKRKKHKDTNEDPKNTNFTYPRGILRGGGNFVPRKTVIKNRTRKRFRVFNNEDEYKNILKSPSKSNFPIVPVNKNDKPSIKSPTINIVNLKKNKSSSPKTLKKKVYVFDVDSHRKSMNYMKTPKKKKNQNTNRKRSFLITNNIISPNSRLTNPDLLYDALNTEDNEINIIRN